jgi:transcriptional regulator with XRE-family HTH domain
MELGALLADAAEAGAQELKKQLKPRRGGSYLTRRPGTDTPMWNACAALLREELRPYGAKARLARFLGVPKQRLSDYLKNGSRMPEAETLLQILNWLAQKQGGRDISL